MIQNVKALLPLALIAWLGGCGTNASDRSALDVPPWLVARPGTAAIFNDRHAPCGSKGSQRAPNVCMAGRIVTIQAVKPNAFTSDDAAVVINDAGTSRRVRGSDLRFVIPSGTVVFCPKVGWWNPPSEFMDGPRGNTRLLAPVRLRVERLVTVDDAYGDRFIDYWIQVLDGDFAGEHGADDGLSPSCEPANRPGIKLVFHSARS